MAKLTRSLTREVEVDGKRLSVTLSADGIEVRAAGADEPVLAMSWAAFLCACVGTKGEPAADAVTDALKRLQADPPAKAPAAAGAGKGGADLPALLGRLDAWLKKNRANYFKGLQGGASAAKLSALGKKLGFAVPDDLKALLAWHNGQSDDVVGGFRDDWRLMSTDQVADARQELDDAKEAAWKPTFVPVLENDRGDCVVVDSTDGKVYEFIGGKPKAEQVAPSLAAYLGEFVSDVEAGRYYEEPERGGFYRKT